MLHCHRVKIFIDGVLETLTALMIDDYPGHPGNKGAPLFTAADFDALVTRADRHGFQISTHAIGDGAIRRTLDGYEAAHKANGRRDSRHRIEHIELIDPADIPRLKELGVIASLQPVSAPTVPGNPLEPILTRVGDKLPYAYAWQLLREAGAVVAFSSDWPVAPLESLPGHAGRADRKTSARRLPAAGPEPDGHAAQLHRRRRLHGVHGRPQGHAEGRLSRRRVVLDADLEATAPDRIATVLPVTTICDGRVTFEG